MNENLERAGELFSKCLHHEDGDERIALGEEAVREADLSGELTMQILTRLVFVRAASFGGANEKALVAFSWLLAKLDENPAAFSEYSAFSEWDVLLRYKWILSSAFDLPQISKPSIYEMLDDFELRSLQAGYGPQTVYLFRYRFEKLCGNREQAIAHYNYMMTLPSDKLSNCPSCLLNEEADFAIYCGDDGRGIELLAPILRGEMNCRVVPLTTFANVLVPLLRLGKPDEALEYHERGYPMIRQNKDFMKEVAEHLTFLVVIRSLEEALQIFKRHVAWLEQTSDKYDHFLFSRAAWLLFDELAGQNSAPLRVRLPKNFPGSSAQAAYSPKELAARFEKHARTLAESFDKRNETDHFTAELCDLTSVRQLCRNDASAQ